MISTTLLLSFSVTSLLTFSNDSVKNDYCSPISKQSGFFSIFENFDRVIWKSEDRSDAKTSEKCSRDHSCSSCKIVALDLFSLSQMTLSKFVKNDLFHQSHNIAIFFNFATILTESFEKVRIDLTLKLNRDTSACLTKKPDLSMCVQEWILLESSNTCCQDMMNDRNLRDKKRAVQKLRET